ncbi:DUF1643 domain-containing protein [Rhizobium ruizarguesonis]|uniref:DUF1643 domain-containing protein n=1 Tax=Rhizobium ruizarguesonis TaxID=2081791 RepID=UPI0010309E5D|nr:DUF1643 domain-containing protein [Rhizobium ruizarguesonis]TBA80293.1 DUF1643 domain-containing protein [Rhizobium ruizarguesonis]
MTLDLLPVMQMSAAISDCTLYRDELRRVWDAGKPLLVVCMLNPSDADHQRNDPTVRDLIFFAKLWGYGGILIVNLHAWRSCSPKEMMQARGSVGPRCDDYIDRALIIARHQDTPMLAAWGAGGEYLGRDRWLMTRARRQLVDCGRDGDITTNCLQPDSVEGGQHFQFRQEFCQLIFELSRAFGNRLCSGYEGMVRREPIQLPDKIGWINQITEIFPALVCRVGCARGLCEAVACQAGIIQAECKRPIEEVGRFDPDWAVQYLVKAAGDRGYRVHVFCHGFCDVFLTCSSERVIQPCDFRKASFQVGELRRQETLDFDLICSKTESHQLLMPFVTADVAPLHLTDSGISRADSKNAGYQCLIVENETYPRVSQILGSGGRLSSEKHRWNYTHSDDENAESKDRCPCFSSHSECTSSQAYCRAALTHIAPIAASEKSSFSGADEKLSGGLRSPPPRQGCRRASFPRNLSSTCAAGNETPFGRSPAPWMEEAS